METQGTQGRRAAVLLAVVVASAAASAACGGGGSPDGHEATGSTSESSTPTPSGSTSESAPVSSPIEGRWEQRHTCQQLVAALERFGLAETAPAIVLDYFPDSTPKEVSAKSDICAGAEPQPHSHFFDAGGRFGSVDADGQQVDDGAYTVDGDVMTIGTDDGGGARFRFSVTGDRLVLEPIITPAAKKAALAKPLDFSVAGWQVAVTYGGVPWHRVPCEQWC